MTLQLVGPGTVTPRLGNESGLVPRRSRPASGSRPWDCEAAVPNGRDFDLELVAAPSSITCHVARAPPRRRNRRGGRPDAGTWRSGNGSARDWRWNATCASSPREEIRSPTAPCPRARYANRPATSGGSSPMSSSGPSEQAAQLGMGEIEVVLRLRHMIGEFVAEGIADAPGAALAHRRYRARRSRPPRHRHLAKPGIGSDAPGAHHAGADALEEPFRLHADFAAPGLPPFSPMRKIFMESDSGAASSPWVTSCILLRAAALPMWVRPVPVTQKRAGSG